MNYSQQNIEKYLERFTSSGFFLEIGCWDGEMISQTAWLERERGWRGLCVDPFPRNFHNRLCQVCEMAVSADGRPREFVKVSIDRRDGGDVSYFSGFKDTIQTHWPLIFEHCDYEIIGIVTLTVDQLYERYCLPDYIQFLSVDTEGSELEIFGSINFDRYAFGMIIFEHNENLIVKNGVGNILKSNGYVLLESLRVDDIYINKREG